MAIVGESGSGKSVTSMSIMRLLEHSGNVDIQGQIDFGLTSQLNILQMSKQEVEALRGNDIA
ncbi:hypothetical protein JCM19241_5411 [Vibrio ishigakensis]|uniref:Uncharacterized protein n=1 Tax=Vibrio ishigakensis TaxID=1481914 RepID=A0A0B8Q3K7_9VIBR|nr:hypothetical protein JCM19241_5411 [Vibrio ishigakensis]